MADTYTDLLKLRMPALGDIGWDDEINDNTQMAEFVLGSVLKSNVVIAGLAASDAGGLDVAVTAGDVVVAGAAQAVASATKTCTAGFKNWLYVDSGGALQIGTSQPTGDYVALAMIDAGTSTIDRIADARNFAEGALTIGVNYTPANYTPDAGETGAINQHLAGIDEAMGTIDTEVADLIPAGTDNHIARYDGTEAIQSSDVIIDDNANLTTYNEGINLGNFGAYLHQDFNDGSLPSDITLTNITATYPTKSIISLESTSADPRLSWQSLNIDGELYRYVVLKLRWVSGSTATDGTIYYATDGGHAESGSYLNNISIDVTGNWKTYIIDMWNLTSGGPDWKDNTIIRIRFDFSNSIGGIFELDWIAIGSDSISGLLNIYEKDGNVGIGEVSPAAKLDINGDLILQNGGAINEFSTDGTFAGNSDSAVPTVKASKTYIANLPTPSFKNKIIDGNFDFWLEATSQTTSGYGSDTMWQNNHTGSSKTHSRQAFAVGQTDVPGNPAYFSRTVVTSSAGSTNDVLKLQRIESVKTFSGQNVTLSFWAKADSAKNIAVEFVQNFGTGGSPSTAVTAIGVTTFNLTSTWQKFTATVAIPSIAGKTIGTDNNDYLVLAFFFDAGSSFDSQTNSLGQQSGTFDLARVQLEDGSVATSFENRPYNIEFNLTQRYFQFVGAGAVGQWTSSSQCQIGFNLQNSLRNSPTGTLLTSTPQIDEVGVAVRTGFSSSIVSYILRSNGGWVAINGFSGATIGNSSICRENNLLTLDSRL